MSQEGFNETEAQFVDPDRIEEFNTFAQAGDQNKEIEEIKSREAAADKRKAVLTGAIAAGAGAVTVATMNIAPALISVGQAALSLDFYLDAKKESAEAKVANEEKVMNYNHSRDLVDPSLSNATSEQIELARAEMNRTIDEENRLLGEAQRKANLSK